MTVGLIFLANFSAALPQAIPSWIYGAVICGLVVAILVAMIWLNNESRKSSSIHNKTNQDSPAQAPDSVYEERSNKSLIHHKLDSDYYARVSGSDESEVRKATEENIHKSIAAGILELDLSSISFTTWREEELSLIGDTETRYTDEKLVFTSIPTDVYKITSLKILNFSNNKITEIKPDIENLLRLEVLLLSNNELGSIPEEIGHLKNLKVLNISNNRIKSLPLQIGNLSSLNELDLSGNNIMFLPKGFEKLSGLKYLNLYNNELVSLPTEIGNLVNLKYLNIKGNRITNIPSQIWDLSELEELIM
jgi:Leucine-rich repeat (LRR) protein